MSNPIIPVVFIKLSKQYWGRYLWVRGYFVSTIGITDEVIKQYIERYQEEERQELLNKWDS